MAVQQAQACSTCLDIHLGDYTLFLLEDYSGGIVVNGKVAVGGNITTPYHLRVGFDPPAYNVSNTLVVGNNLHLTGGNVYGDTWYGGSFLPNPNWTVNFHGYTLTRDTPSEFADRDFATRFAELRSLSERLATQVARGTVRREGDVLTLTGDDECLNVFTVSASDFTGTTQRNIFVPAGSFTLVNIHGTGTTLRGGFNADLNSRRVLYNFVDATRLDLAGMVGTVLAPHARVIFNEGGWFGGIYAISLSGGGTGNYSPLDEVAGATAEVCNGTDDDCNGQVDEGFDCIGSGSRNCLDTRCGAEGTQSCNPATCGYGRCISTSCCDADADCAQGSYCEGNRCVAQRGNGETCTADNQCTQGHCVDDVCCDTACAGACDACALEGSLGTCTPVPGGSEGAPSCAPYVCSGEAATCPSQCVQDSQCAEGHYCHEGACVATRDYGETCTADNQCTHGHCVDDVCCNSACDGACDACNLTGSVGTCSLAPPTMRCRAAGSSCDAEEYCTGTGASCPADGFRPSGAECTSDSNACTVDQCDGAGSCTHSAVTPGTTCGGGQVCNAAGQCMAQCWIAGVPYEAGTINPSQPCQVCDPSQSTSSWSSAADGTSCGTSQGDWGSCGGFSDPCGMTGTQSRTVTTSTCGAGVCSPSNSHTEIRECTRNTEGVQCRAGGVCDVAESCAGGVCPADAKMPAGASCDDGNAGTTGDRCDGTGVCTGCGDGVKNGTEACDDGNIVTETSCPPGQATCTACNATCTAVLNLTGTVGCSSTTRTWSQFRSAWNGNPSTAGTYTCRGRLPATSHGLTVEATLTSSERTGDAEFKCENGSWTRVSGSCDGEITTKTDLICSSSDDPEGEVIGWYLSDLKRCADISGLAYWVGYVDDSGVCVESCSPNSSGALVCKYIGDGFSGAQYDSRDACLRAGFRHAAESTGEWPNAGHIHPDAEANQCGSGAAPWTNIKSAGMKCKARP